MAVSLYRVVLSGSYCSTCGSVQRGVLEYEADAQCELFTHARPLFLSLACARRSPLWFEGCVGCADGGAVAAFKDEGGAQVRVRRVFAADFCDLFGSQVALGERPQGDCSFNLRGAHAVGVGELACGFDPGADDAAAVVLALVVVVVAVGEIIAVHCEAVGVQACAVGERGCGMDSDVGSVGEGDGAGGEVEVSRVNDLLTGEQVTQGAGVVLGGVGVDGVDHGVFSCVGAFSCLALL